jgi:cyclic beta-1,2-glucan synthetase
VRHGLGLTVSRLEAEDLHHETLVSVDRADPVKLVTVRLRNTGTTVRSLSLISYARLVLGPAESAARRIVTAHDRPRDALTATNAASGAWALAVAFSNVVTTPRATVEHTTDRASFLGRHGDASRPHALRVPDAFDGATVRSTIRASRGGSRSRWRRARRARSRS